MKEIQRTSMNNYSSLHIGGEADLVIAENENNINEIHSYVQSNGLKMYVLGMGTNSFYSDVIKDTLIVKIEIPGINFKDYGDYVVVTAGAGELWDDVVKYSCGHQYWGTENLSNIPGTIGASPVQNIGAYGVELKDILESVRAYDTSTSSFVELSNIDCHFGYRDSIFKQNKGRYIITSVSLKLSKTPNPILMYKPLDSLLEKNTINLSEVRDLVIKTRTEKLPDYKIYPNTGSFFKNPIITSAQGNVLKEKYNDIPLHEVKDGYKIPAAWLIEHVAEMKGVRVGEIGTWPNQPLVLVNYGNATCENLLSFANLIVGKIEEKTGIRLEREVNYVE
ncbi:UDP-N-acetylmuramate dehydrogenase [Candidatus Gracilibacteria bacterium]|nr:UDP-N-acetylmuramate dehydrogenase [Candidatus Gracilibacteria bacterium]MCF7898617.1 UDP-N-acetylmuramate dehydrogenase [Candidatus Paceibacterota bacterium]